MTAIIGDASTNGLVIRKSMTMIGFMGIILSAVSVILVMSYVLISKGFSFALVPLTLVQFGLVANMNRI